MAKFLFTLLLLIPTAGFALSDTFRWEDPNPKPSPVVAFFIHYGPGSENYTMVVDVGLPSPDENDIYSISVDVGVGLIYIAMTVTNIDGFRSAYSNELTRCVHANGDFNGDGEVSIIDFARFALAFLMGDINFGADMDCDGSIDISDFSILAELYGR